MGRRKKSRKAPVKKIIPKVPTSFDCPFCNHDKSVECKMDRKKSIGKVHCQICGADYITRIHYLSDPIDVYSEWIDECQKMNEPDEEDNEQQIVEEEETHNVQQEEEEEQQQQQIEEEEEEEEPNNEGVVVSEESSSDDE